MVGRGARVSNDLIKNSVSAEERKILIAASEKPHCIVLDNGGLYKDHGLPDKRIDWQRHFNGYKKEKKPTEEMIEIFIAEDESGRQVRTKIPKEIEGLKLIEITHKERERIQDLSSLREFDRMFALFQRLPKINKPGFKAYFEYRDYCRKNSISMDKPVWEYLKLRLSIGTKEIDEKYMAKLDAIAKFSDADFLRAKIEEHHAREIDQANRLIVPEWFLKKEREKYLSEMIMTNN